jgi:probable rRNA maturation factor
MIDASATDGFDGWLAHVEADAASVLRFFACDDAELSILLCDDATIWPLNRDYRHKDRPTDVLAFAQREGTPVPGQDHVLGDVVISVETAARQAEERGHSTAHELRVLVVHGICHLLGYDHEDDADAEVMEAKEREILGILGPTAAEFAPNG